MCNYMYNNIVEYPEYVSIFMAPLRLPNTISTDSNNNSMASHVHIHKLITELGHSRAYFVFVIASKLMHDYATTTAYTIVGRNGLHMFSG